MNTSDTRVTPGRRSRVRLSLSASFALVLLSSAAQAGTILQFAQTNPADSVTAKESGGVTTLSTAGNANGGGVSIPVTISNFLGKPGLSIPAFETYVGVTSTGPATTVLGQILQGFTGTIEITSGVGGTGSNYLTATFTVPTASGVLGGTSGGTQAQLSATEPPQSLALTSDFAKFYIPTSMTVGFSNVDPALGIKSGSISSFKAQNAATFGAVPEPATFGLACMGVVFVALAVGCSRRFRQRAAKV